MLQTDCASLSLSLSVWGIMSLYIWQPVVFLCGHILTLVFIKHFKLCSCIQMKCGPLLHTCHNINTGPAVSILVSSNLWRYIDVSNTELICIRRVFSKCSHVREKLWTATHGHFVNLGEEVILTLLWQSGSSESATVYFVISISICYWLFRVRTRVCVCVRERVTSRHVS